MHDFGVIIKRLPLSWWVYFFLILFLVAAVGGFLAFGRYALKTEMAAVIEQKNQINIHSDRAAIVADVLVNSGDSVQKKAPLVILRNASGALPLARIRQLQTQIAEQTVSHALASNRLDEQVDNLKKQISVSSADPDIYAKSKQILAHKVEALSGRRDQTNELIAAGFLGKNAALEVQSQLMQAQYEENNALIQQRDAQRRHSELLRQLQQLQQAQEQLRIEKSRSLATLEEQLAREQASEGFALTSPQDAHNLQLLVNKGDVLREGTLIATAAKSSTSSLLEVKLFADSKAVGFLKKGDQVRLRLDAFPYERFGTVEAEVRSVGRTPTDGRTLNLAGMEGKFGYVIVASVAERQPHFSAPLAYVHNGMTARAAVKLQSMSIFEWLVLPVIRGLKRNPDFGSTTALGAPDERVPPNDVATVVPIH